MIKTKIVETTEKYDENGKLVERVVREEETEDDETRYPVSVSPEKNTYSYSQQKNNSFKEKIEITC